jgi:alkanesulfonate monooxygenase SsuD/methylene tetrahydromethanopterin reductase-like flavin-dependent oxidoreductase (luciferase family)
MRLGLQLPSFTYPGGAAAIRATLTEIGQAAEDAGLASLWVMDHWFQLPETAAGVGRKSRCSRRTPPKASNT